MPSICGGRCNHSIKDNELQPTEFETASRTLIRHDSSMGVDLEALPVDLMESRFLLSRDKRAQAEVQC